MHNGIGSARLMGIMDCVWVGQVLVESVTDVYPWTIIE